MNKIVIMLGTFLCIAVAGYFGSFVIANHIDQRSGEIVEHTLSENSIAQLELLSEIQVLLKNGNVEAANEKLLKASEAIRYILQEYCSKQKCKDALNKYGS
ncbi:MAG: hypothetical protein GY954_09820 [Alteromonas sp.]|nr:hypothetical protein [Alteromonas sp.]